MLIRELTNRFCFIYPLAYQGSFEQTIQLVGFYFEVTQKPLTLLIVRHNRADFHRIKRPERAFFLTAVPL